MIDKGLNILLLILSVFFIALICFFWLRQLRARFFSIPNKPGPVLENPMGDTANNLIITKATYRKRRRFKMGLLIFIGWLFSLGSLLLIALKIYSLIAFNHEAHESRLSHVLDHFDVTGVAIGIIGIIVGLLIYYIVDESDEEKAQELKANIEKVENTSDTLSKNIDNVLDITKNIESYLSSLNLIGSLKKRFEDIELLIEHAKDNNNELFILSYSPNYGQSIMSNLKVIKDETDWDGNEISHEDLQKYFSVLKDLRQKNEMSLKDFSKSFPDRLHMAILRSSLIDNLSQDKFRHFLKERVLKNKKVLLIDKDCKNENVKLPPESEFVNTFLLEVENISTEEPLNNEKNIATLIDRLIRNDSSLIRHIPAANIEPLDYVPFQFYLSVPGKDQKNNQKFNGVIVFTNYYDLGQSKSIISFSTKQRDLIEGLNSMFNILINSQQELNQKLAPVKRIFATNTKNKTIKFILKRESGNQEDPHFQKYYKVTPIADNKAKDNMQVYFDKYNIAYDEEIIYAHDLNLSNKEEPFSLNGEKDELIDFNKENIYVSIGLFYNVVTEYVVDVIENHQPSIKKNMLFELRNFVEKGISTKKIAIASKGVIRQSVTYAPDLYSESFFRNEPKETTDYAIISKQKIKNSWVFTMGGIDHFGTENIVSCLACPEFLRRAEKLNQEKQTQEFVAIFKISKSNTIKVDLLSYSFTDPDGVIKHKNLQGSAFG